MSSKGLPVCKTWELYTRFYREISSVKSTGPGLAIVQKIGETWVDKPSYFFIAHRPVFKVALI